MTLREASAIVSEHDLVGLASDILFEAAALTAERGRAREAAQLIGAADRMLAESGLFDFEAEEHEALRQDVAQRLHGAFEREWTVGQTLAPPDALSCAMRTLDLT